MMLSRRMPTRQSMLGGDVRALAIRSPMTDHIQHPVQALASRFWSEGAIDESSDSAHGGEPALRS